MTQKGNLKLIHDGFEFSKVKTNKKGNITYWACLKKTGGCCIGRAQTRRIGSREMVKVYNTHNHFPN